MPPCPVRNCRSNPLDLLQHLATHRYDDEFEVNCIEPQCRELEPFINYDEYRQHLNSIHRRAVNNPINPNPVNDQVNFNQVNNPVNDQVNPNQVNPNLVNNVVNPNPVNDQVNLNQVNNQVNPNPVNNAVNLNPVNNAVDNNANPVHNNDDNNYDNYDDPMLLQQGFFDLEIEHLLQQHKEFEDPIERIQYSSMYHLYRLKEEKYLTQVVIESVKEMTQSLFSTLQEVIQERVLENLDGFNNIPRIQFQERLNGVWIDDIFEGLGSTWHQDSFIDTHFSPIVFFFILFFK